MLEEDMTAECERHGLSRKDAVRAITHAKDGVCELHDYEVTHEDPKSTKLFVWNYCGTKDSNGNERFYLERITVIKPYRKGRPADWNPVIDFRDFNPGT